MTSFNNKGFALVHLLFVIVTIVFVSSFLAKKAKSDIDFKAASITASRIDFLLNEAYTYYRFNGKWPVSGDPAIGCLGGDGVVVGAGAGAVQVIPEVIPVGWGDISAFTFDCSEVGGTYSVKYRIPDEWTKFMITNVSNTKVDLAPLSPPPPGEAAMVSTINKAWGGGRSEILVAGFVANGSKLEAELETVKCKHDPDAIWTYSVSAICNHTESTPLVSTILLPLLFEGVTIKGWRLKVEKYGDDRYKFESQSYRVEQTTEWDTFVIIPYAYTEYKGDWVASEADCGGVISRVTAFVQCKD